MNSVKLSIIIPVYNNYKSLKRCLQSIAKQSFKDFEVVVVDDGSFPPLTAGVPTLTAGVPTLTAGVLTSGLNKEKIKWYCIEHGGAPKARNFGFRQSAGEYLFFCDADIIFLKPDTLQKMVEVLDKNPNPAFCYSLFKYGWKKFYRGPFNIEKLKQNNYISSNSMLRRKYFPGWDESLSRFQDWDLWLTMVERGGEGVFIPEVLWQAKAGGTMSQWLPEFFYKFKFLKSVKEFERAKEIVKKKHGLI